MKRVALRLHGPIAKEVGKEVIVSVSGNATLQEILRDLRLGNRDDLMFMVNDEVVYEDYVPKDGDVVDVYPLSFGG